MSTERHEEFDALAAGWVLHALEADEAARFAEHLSGCAECRRTTEELEATVAELAHAVPGVEPPEGALERLRIAAGTAVDPDLPWSAPPRPATRSGEPPAPRSTDPSDEPVALGGGSGPAPVVPLRRGRARRDVVIRWVAAAAAVAAVVLAGWNVALHREADQQRQMVAQREAMLAELVQSRRMAALAPPADSRRPVAYVMADDGVLMVATHGVEENTPGRTSLWLWGQWGSERRPLARFDVETETVAVHRLGGIPPEMDGVDGFAVSLEPGTARPTTPSRIVAIGAVES